MQPWLACYNGKLQVNILSRPLPEVIFHTSLVDGLSSGGEPEQDLSLSAVPWTW